jgi:hypothetical protein
MPHLKLHKYRHVLLFAEDIHINEEQSISIAPQHVAQNEKNTQNVNF